MGDAQNPKTFFHGHTYGGNPLGAAVALASLQRLRRRSTPWQSLIPKTDHLAARLESHGPLDHVGNVRQRGLDRRHRTGRLQADQGALPTRTCRRRRGSAGGPAPSGLLIRPLGDVLVIMPPLSITVSELDQMLDVIESLIIEVTKRNPLVSLPGLFITGTDTGVGKTAVAAAIATLLTRQASPPRVASVS